MLYDREPGFMLFKMDSDFTLKFLIEIAQIIAHTTVTRLLLCEMRISRNLKMCDNLKKYFL